MEVGGEGDYIPIATLSPPINKPRGFCGRCEPRWPSGKAVGW